MRHWLTLVRFTFRRLRFMPRGYSTRTRRVDQFHCCAYGMCSNATKVQVCGIWLCTEHRERLEILEYVGDEGSRPNPRRGLKETA
jgi:hypothetical protein